jgi:hypothetical protein
LWFKCRKTGKTNKKINPSFTDNWLLAKLGHFPQNSPALPTASAIALSIA